MAKFQARNLNWLFLSLLVIILDQISKSIILNNIRWGETIRVLPFFNLTLIWNRGAAFSLLHDASGWQFWLFAGLAAVVSIVVIVWLSCLKRHSVMTALGLSLVLGGALGNLYDRIFRGFVVDFIELHAGKYYWPVFNLADTSICIGAILLVLCILRSKKQKTVKD